MAKKPVKKKWDHEELGDVAEQSDVEFADSSEIAEVFEDIAELPQPKSNDLSGSGHPKFDKFKKGN